MAPLLGAIVGSLFAMFLPWDPLLILIESSTIGFVVAVLVPRRGLKLLPQLTQRSRIPSIALPQYNGPLLLPPSAQNFS